MSEKLYRIPKLKWVAKHLSLLVATTPCGSLEIAIHAHNDEVPNPQCRLRAKWVFGDTEFSELLGDFNDGDTAIDDAKAAAQEHFEQRMASGLEEYKG